MRNNGGRRNKQGKPEVDKKDEHNGSISGIGAFLLEFSWEFVTWICVPACFLVMGYFLTVHNSRGAWWSGIAVGIALLVMLGLFGDRHWFRKEKVDRTAEPDPPVRISEDRAWLKVAIVPNGPITFYDGGRKGVRIPVEYQVRNTGRSPANDVRIQDQLFFPKFGSKPTEKLRQICDLMRDPRYGGYPFGSGVVFPGDPPTHRQTAHLATLNDMLEFEKPMRQNPSAEASGEHVTQPYIGGCLRYKYGPPGAELIGETAYLFKISVRAVDNPRTTLLVKIGEDVPQEQVVIDEPSSGGGGYAK